MLALVAAVPGEALALPSVNPEGTVLEGVARRANLPLVQGVAIDAFGPGECPKLSESQFTPDVTESKLARMRRDQLTGKSAALEAQIELPQVVPDARGSSCDGAAIVQNSPITQNSMSFSGTDLLGTVSVAIAHTPFDDKWSGVSARLGKASVRRLVSEAGADQSAAPLALVEAVNRWVNHHITVGEDRDIYGVADHWAPAGETLRRGIGDCEDFAIVKLEFLAALGFSRSDLRLVVTRDLVRNADHAVLIVMLPDGPLLLDNTTDLLLDGRLPNDYRPIMSFSENTKWVHGEATQATTRAQLASADTAVQTDAVGRIDVPVLTVDPVWFARSIAVLNVPVALPKKPFARA